MKVLIIEDDIQIVEAIKLAFKIRWSEAEVTSVALGEKGIDFTRTDRPDIVILDLGLPDISGFEVLKRIRQFSKVPILILTVMADESDKVRGLEWGADDYVTKPFKQLELLARVRALLRRLMPSDEGPMVRGVLSYKPDTFQFFHGDNELNLTRTEGVIIRHLMKNYGQVVTHASMAEAIWGVDYPDSAQSLKVYIRRVREKLENDPGQPRLLLTKAGIGYYLAKTEE
ncbi:MAG: response regulator transcription factor [Dehalococcoidales bacterium]|nr:response regulator transcription factor [Dehalococcoidales bacterium]